MEASLSAKTNKLKTLAELEAGECRWPIGDPRQEGFHFCGARQAEGRPYCLAHWQLSFIPGKQRNQPAPAPLPIRQAA